MKRNQFIGLLALGLALTAPALQGAAGGALPFVEGNSRRRRGLMGFTRPWMKPVAVFT